MIIKNVGIAPIGAFAKFAASIGSLTAIAGIGHSTFGYASWRSFNAVGGGVTLPPGLRYSFAAPSVRLFAGVTETKFTPVAGTVNGVTSGFYLGTFNRLAALTFPVFGVLAASGREAVTFTPTIGVGGTFRTDGSEAVAFGSTALDEFAADGSEAVGFDSTVQVAGSFTADGSESDLFAASTFIPGGAAADGTEAVEFTSTASTIGQRGSIAYDQIKVTDRTGTGDQLLTYSPVPAAATSPGTPGQVAFDAAGNWYWCYAVNSWARIGPAGYGSAAASPPSW